MTGIVNMMLGAQPFRASSGPGGQIATEVQAPSGAQAGLTFGDDGNIYRVQQGVPTKIGEWVTPTDYVSLPGWAVEFELLDSAGSTFGTFDEPQALTSDRGCSATASPPATEFDPPNQSGLQINAIVTLNGTVMSTIEYQILAQSNPPSS